MKVIKTLGIYIVIYLICSLIHAVTQGVLMTVFNAVFRFIADDAWRMYYSSLAVRFLVLIVLFWVIYFTAKYRLIFDKLELAREYEGDVPTARELLAARMKNPQNITEAVRCCYVQGDDRSIVYKYLSDKYAYDSTLYAAAHAEASVTES